MRLESTRKDGEEIIKSDSKHVHAAEKSNNNSRANLLQASTNFLSKEMRKARSWIFPPRDEDKVKLHTQKNPMPPKATATLGFPSQENIVQMLKRELLLLFFRN